jgi:hypothetical protein
MQRKVRLLVAAVGVLAVTGALLVPGGASGTSSLPTLNIALNGVKGVSVSGSMVSGAVNIVSTFTGKAPSGPNANGPSFGLARLNPGVTFQQAAGAVQSHHGDINAINPYGALLVDASAPGSVQAVLTPGNWVALNITGNGNPGAAAFTVTAASSPAALPAASATESAIEFGFRGPSVLHDGTLVRAENQGYLVHMIVLEGVRSKAAGLALVAVLHRTSSFRAARPYLNGAFGALLGPVSSGGMQQAVLNVKPGYYVEACFMDTQDHRVHTLLGMERLIRIVR